MENIEKYSDSIISFVVKNGVNILTAAAVFFIGMWFLKKLSKMVRKMLNKSSIDKSLVPFLSGIVDMTLKVLLIITVVGMVGIEMTSFIAILGAAGLAVGMALSGTLQNFAGSVMILIFKPFKVGDLLEAHGYLGIVKEIQIFNTIMNTLDNKTIILPNGPLSGTDMTNYNGEPTKRVDMRFGIGYGDDIDKTRSVLEKLIKADKRILENPAPRVHVAELGDNAVILEIRPWAKTSDYWEVYFDMQENVKKAFDKEGISFPFPQRDVHVYKESTE